MSVLDKMLDALTSAYNAKPGGNIGKLFSILADTFDVLGDTFAKIRAWRDVDSAAKAFGFVRVDHGLKEGPSVVHSIGIRKAVAQIVGDFLVARIFNEGWSVFSSPLSKRKFHIVLHRRF